MIKKLIIISTFAVLLGLAIVLPSLVLADTNTNSNGNSNSNANVNARPALDPACMQTAVEKRDAAIITAWDAYAVAIKSALSTRKDALKAAWGLNTKKEIKQAIKKVWNAYSQSIKKIQQNFKKAKAATWKQYRLDRKTCGNQATATDAQSSEGQDANL